MKGRGAKGKGEGMRQERKKKTTTMNERKQEICNIRQDCAIAILK